MERQQKKKKKKDTRRSENSFLSNEVGPPPALLTPLGRPRFSEFSRGSGARRLGVKYFRKLVWRNRYLLFRPLPWKCIWKTKKSMYFTRKMQTDKKYFLGRSHLQTRPLPGRLWPECMWLAFQTVFPYRQSTRRWRRKTEAFAFALNFPYDLRVTSSVHISNVSSYL